MAEPKIPDKTDTALESDTSLTLNPDAYRHYLADLAMSAEEEMALLGALWEIMVAFSGLGFGVDAVQLVDALTEKARTAQNMPLEQMHGQQRGVFNQASHSHNEKEVSDG